MGTVLSITSGGAVGLLTATAAVGLLQAIKSLKESKSDDTLRLAWNYYAELSDKLKANDR